MKEKKDWGLITVIVALVLVVSFIIGSIIYQIYEDNKKCYNFVVEYENGSICDYHCEYYYTYDTHFRLFLHDGTELVLTRANLLTVSISEVID